jgi:hypothetical protein
MGAAKVWTERRGNPNIFLPLTAGMPLTHNVILQHRENPRPAAAFVLTAFALLISI